jgi:hypothetical protein
MTIKQAETKVIKTVLFLINFSEDIQRLL